MAGYIQRFISSKINHHQCPRLGENTQRPENVQFCFYHRSTQNRPLAVTELSQNPSLPMILEL